MSIIASHTTREKNNVNNIIQLCEANGVEACIFSSTGKASRYFTPDIYAASKKIAEWLFSDRSQPRNCQYGIVRFTHVVENVLDILREGQIQVSNELVATLLNCRDHIALLIDALAEGQLTADEIQAHQGELLLEQLTPYLEQEQTSPMPVAIE